MCAAERSRMKREMSSGMDPILLVPSPKAASIENTPCAHKLWAPVAIAHRSDLHAAAGLHRVHEATTTEIDTVVRDAGRVGIGEKHDVARLELASPDGSPVGELRRGIAVQRHAELAMDVVDQPAAVEAGPG